MSKSKILLVDPSYDSSEAYVRLLRANFEVTPALSLEELHEELSAPGRGSRDDQTYKAIVVNGLDPVDVRKQVPEFSGDIVSVETASRLNAPVAKTAHQIVLEQLAGVRGEVARIRDGQPYKPV